MKKQWICILIALLCAGCTSTQAIYETPENQSLHSQEEEQAQIEVPVDLEVDDNATIDEQALNPQVPRAYYALTDAQQNEIRSMIVDSKAYDEYTPGSDSFVLDFYRNAIGITAQAKDWPTMWLVRFEDIRFDGTSMVYFMQRFYREYEAFTYEKNGVTKKAELEVSYWINQDNNTRARWNDRIVECSLYVPGATGQTTYIFKYDAMENAIYEHREDDAREPITFTEDLHQKVLDLIAAKINKFIQIDEKAQRLAQDIVSYVEQIEE